MSLSAQNTKKRFKVKLRIYILALIGILILMHVTRKKIKRSVSLDSRKNERLKNSDSRLDEKIHIYLKLFSIKTFSHE